MSQGKKKFGGPKSLHKKGQQANIITTFIQSKSIFSTNKIELDLCKVKLG